MFKIQLTAATNPFQKIALLRMQGFPVGENVKLGEGVELLGSNLSIGDNSRIGRGSKLVFDNLTVGQNVTIGEDCDIRSKNISFEDGVDIGPGMKALVADELFIGRNARIGHSAEIICRKAVIGEGLFAEHHMVIGGGGGVMGPRSQITIGKFVHIGEYTILNTAREVTIGDYAGLGAYVMVYTHGMWPPALDGYPVEFGPVHIGAGAWVPGRIIVLPGVTIGDGALVGIGSLVNRDIPPRCLAAGIPAKVLRENYYPKPFSPEEKDQIIKDIFEQYIPELRYKGYEVNEQDFGGGLALEIDATTVIAYRYKIDEVVRKSLEAWLDKRLILLYFECELTIDFSQRGENHTYFDIAKYEVKGKTDEISEDVRDFLRRNCVRFYTPDKFRSIVPPAFKWLMEA